MGFADDKKWDKYRDEKHRPGTWDSNAQRNKVYLGLGAIGMAMFLALLYFSP